MKKKEVTYINSVYERSMKITKPELIEALEKQVEEGRLIEINYDDSNPSFQETDAFLSNLWGVMSRYNTRCVKCKNPIDREQETYTSVVAYNDFYFLHEYCQRNNGHMITRKEIESIIAKETPKHSSHEVKKA